MSEEQVLQKTRGPLIYRQSIWTRVTHWIWAICLFFLLLTGLQIFNAHPALYIGQQSGFEFENAVLEIGAVNTDAGPRGRTTIFGQTYDTTGVLGMSGPAERPVYTAFPGEVTIPSYRDLGTGRVVHFFFGWIFVATMLVWFVASFINGHIRRDIVPKGADLAGVPRDVADHARLRFHHGRSYGPLQKLSYFGVFFILFPLIVATGLTMSPGMNALAPWMLDLFGGRQTARTIHFVVMLLLVTFFVVHVLMVVAAGPINELRSMITGWYRASPGTPGQQGDKP
ncbi:MAG: cytochrome b/b6 domain-containing protein [Candidatus Devosia phytovorans]|uniref:Cytochrome b/b6 domain-containing protein n=1 Tax=Candidatus Devosia phytovorans TaxID=3121372 RepID=A0AAJ5VX76_9HYPH|nr:cytochrome b/b6 domain-containing protein [Devosia sp.]WEK05133.1 MAG: cytochrome b/b6 domain-containing protein [Devosia sp.]